MPKRGSTKKAKFFGFPLSKTGANVVYIRNLITYRNIM